MTLNTTYHLKTGLSFLSVITAVIIFALGGFSVKPVVVLSESMEPDIYPGDLLMIKTVT